MYDGPDVPSADLPEDITGPEPQAVPLDVSTLHKVPGYETVGYYTDGKFNVFNLICIRLVVTSSALKPTFVYQIVCWRNAGSVLHFDNVGKKSWIDNVASGTDIVRCVTLLASDSRQQNAEIA